MSEITLLGLGAMGAALGRVLLENKFEITVWNRSKEKTKLLTDHGAIQLDTLEEAIEASPRIMICITEYETAYEMLCQPSITKSLVDKTIIQLSTGTPGEVRRLDELVKSYGANYIDGSIMVYPETIGEESAQILVAGEEEIFRDCEPFINCLAGDVRYVGDKIGAAAALDLAVLSRLCAITPGVVNGANICESEGVPLTHYADLFPEGDRARSVVMSIYNNDFAKNISAPVSTAITCLSSIKRHSEELGINSDIPSFGLELYRKADDSGFGNYDAASLIEVLRHST